MGLFVQFDESSAHLIDTVRDTPDDNGLVKVGQLFGVDGCHGYNQSLQNDVSQVSLKFSSISNENITFS